MKKNAFISIFILFFSIPTSAIDTLLLRQHLFKAAPRYSILIDKKYSLEQAVSNFSNTSLLVTKDPGKIQRSFNDYWTGIYLQNNYPDTLRLIAEAYIKEAWLNDKLLLVCGKKPCMQAGYPFMDKYVDVTFITVPPGIHLFTAKISDYHLPVYFAPLLSNAIDFEGKTYISGINSIFLFAIILGIFLFAAAISSALYYKIKDKALLWYSLYCCLVVLSGYLSLQTNYQVFYWSFQYIPWIYTKMFVPVALLFTYTKFAQHFIDAKSKMPKVYKAIKRLAYLSIATLLPEIIFLLLGNFRLSYAYYFLVRILLTVAGGILMVLLWKHRHSLYVKFILIGSAFVILGELSSNLVYRQYSPLVAGAGVLVDIIIFTIGIAYRVNTHYEKEKKLDNELLIKEREVTVLFKDNNSLNMSLFQNQMNPHFIFNSLNSIKEMILMDKNEEASKYLSKFGHLIRLNLEHNNNQFITIKENNEHLKAYLEMESLRFNNFIWDITVDESVEDDLLIPPMLVQPVVENAIWHGLLPKDNNRKLSIRYTLGKDHLFCVVDDNGIGIKKSLENRKDKQYKSVGVENTRNRVAILKEKYKQQYEIIITDKRDMETETTRGTVVVLSLPIMYKNN